MTRERLSWWKRILCGVTGVLVMIPSAHAQWRDRLHSEPAGGEESLRQEERAREAAQKEAMAEWILTREEAASGRPFDRAFRMRINADLALRSFEELAEVQNRGKGLLPGPYNLGDSQADLVYTPVTPCRIIDTRIVGGPIAAGTTRNFFVAEPGSGTYFSNQGGNAGTCNIPFGPATAAVINFVAVNPAGAGNLQVTPFGTAMPTASFINYALPGSGLNLANGLVVTICDDAQVTCTLDITIQANVSAVQLVADVQGYFRKVRKEQVKSFVQSASSATETSIGNACTHMTGAQITVSAPGAGKVLVSANVNLFLNHTLSTEDVAAIYLGTSASDCTIGDFAEVNVPDAWPTDSIVETTVPVSHVFTVGAAGDVTYNVNGKMFGGQDALDRMHFAGLYATFIPD